MATGVANAVKKYRSFQVGKEATYGTEVNATKKLSFEEIEWNDQGAQRLYEPQYTIGRFTQHTSAPTVTRSGLGKSTITMPLSFQEFHFAMFAGFKGNVAAVEKTGGQGDYERIFQNDPNTIDVSPDPYTMEFQLGGSSNFPTTAPGGIVSSFEISATADGDMTQLKTEFWSRATNSNAITVGLSPISLTLVPALAWKFSMADSWVTMDTFGAAPSYGVGGGTQWSTTVTGFTFKYNCGNDPSLYIGDGRTDPSKHKPMPRGAELELTCEYNANVDGEKAKAAAGTKRYFRMLGEGARIGTGYNYSILIQGCYIYPDGGFGSFGNANNEYENITLKLASLPDDDTEDIEIRTINNTIGAAGVW